MTEKIHHSLTERGFQITAPKELVDLATSRWGAMLDETRKAPTLRVLERQYQNGGIVLNFDVTKPGTGPATGPMEERAGRMVDLMVQMNDVALEEGLDDPHFRISRKKGNAFEDQLLVLVDHDDENQDTNVTIACNAMMKYGRLMGYYERYRDDAPANIFYDSDGNITLLTGKGTRNEKTTQLSSRSAESSQDTVIELSTHEDGFNKRGVLITVLGALSLASPAR
ncbi:MAG: hypothetical protein WAR37_05170 [Candidatus Microsaccharimonas sp.]